MGNASRIVIAGLLLVLAAAAARADGKLGIVLMHGKLGLPLGTAEGRGPATGAQLIEALKGAGYLVSAPELCWSRRRGFDKPYADCLAEIDAAVAELKSRGATAIVIGGLSLGGNAALAYGASHAGLLGIIGLGPADDPQRKANQPQVAAALDKARALMAAGKGDERDTFADVNTGAQGGYPMALTTTARIYLSFSDPNAAGLATNTAKLTAPLLWVAGSQDPTQRNAPEIFQRAPANPLNRYVAVAANHLATPDAAADAAIAWLATLQKL